MTPAADAKQDPLRAARGIAAGCLIGVALWAGCTAVAVRVYRNGPATFVTGDRFAVADYCRWQRQRVAAWSGGDGSGGCSHWTATTTTVACADDNPECIAHELHHLTDKTWRHK